MKGNIFSRKKCCMCGGSLVHDERRHGLFCKKHPQIAAVSKFTVRFGRDIQKQFSNYQNAAQFLNGIRFKTSEGTFDFKDYKAEKPYSFINLSNKYLNKKRNLKSFKDKKRHIVVAQEYFGERNIKEITGADVEDYLFSIENISEKTRANYKSSISDLWKWCLKRQILNLAQMPYFPEIDYELGYRNITDLETQRKIVDKVYEMTYKTNPKIWFGIELLSTYVNLRPGDLLKLNESDVDEINGVLTFRYPTKKKNKLKTTRMIDEHTETLKDLKEEFPALPHIPFFRHHGGIKGIKPNTVFGPKYFRIRWNAACKELGIEGLDLYGGTRHTTTTEIARLAGTENARKASAHTTNKAFDRYCQFQEESAFDMAKIVKSESKKSKIKQFRKKTKKT